MWFPDSWTLFSKRHTRRLSRGDALGALRLARKYADANPADARAWIRVGDDARRVNDHDTAASAFAKAATLVPDDVGLRYEAGKAELHQGLLDEAQKTFGDLLDIGRQDASALAHIGLGRVSAQQRNPDDAIAHARQAESLIPPDKGEWFQELASLVLALPGQVDWSRDLFAKADEAGAAGSASHAFLAALLEDSDPTESARQLELARSKWWGTPRQFGETIEGVRQTVRLQGRAAQN